MYGPSNLRRSIPAKAGIGLRFQHHAVVLEQRPGAAWFEVHSENYLSGGPPLRDLETIRSDYPVSLHGVGLSLGSAEGLDAAHLERVAELIDRIEPNLVSEHMSWSIGGGAYLADLLPLPLTEEALGIICVNVERAQDRFKRRLLIENPSSYLRYQQSIMSEEEFLSAIAKRTGCGVLCDVNNIYVSAANHGWDASAYLKALPVDSVGEIHLAGHSSRLFEGGRRLFIDDHGSAVPDAVWDLYREALDRFGPVPSLIEWDNEIPSFERLQEEVAKADRHLMRMEDHADAA